MHDLETMQLLTLKTVLSAIDVDDSSLPAIETGHRLARASGARLHVVHVSNSPGAERAVAACLARLDVPPEQAAVHVIPGDPVLGVELLAGRIGADVLVVGSHRPRPDRNFPCPLGTTAMALVTTGNVPCLIADRPLPLPLGRVVVAVDISDAARGALMVGLSWASALRATEAGASGPTRLTALHVKSPAQDVSGALEEEVARVRREAGSWAGVAIETITTEASDAASGIAEFATQHGADVIVLGTRGLGASDDGCCESVSASVLRRLDSSVLLVPPAMWKSYAEAG